jgi:hypothetical protein
MLEALQQLAGALHRLDESWRQRVMKRTAFLNPHLVAETMSVGAVVSGSLQNKRPISSAVPRSLLDRLIFYASVRHGSGETTRREDDEALTWATMQNEELATFATAVLASTSFLAQLDQAHEVVRELVGTVEMRLHADRTMQYAHEH